MSKITNDGLTRSMAQDALYSCTHMASVGVKGLNPNRQPYEWFLNGVCIQSHGG